MNTGGWVVNRMIGQPDVQPKTGPLTNRQGLAGQHIHPALWCTARCAAAQPSQLRQLSNTRLALECREEPNLLTSDLLLATIVKRISFRGRPSVRGFITEGPASPQGFDTALSCSSGSTTWV